MKFILFLLLASFYSHWAMALDCTSLWSSGFPDQGRTHTSFDCQEVETGSGQVKLFYSHDVASTPNLNEMTEAIKASLVRSYSRYHGLGAMPDIKAIIYHRPSYQDRTDDFTYASAITEFPSSSEACPIIVYPHAFHLDTNYLKQLIAHEVFHCYQWKNYTTRTTLGTGHHLGVWWLEGTAEFMSNYVYPTIDMEYDSHFVDAYLPRTPMPQQRGYGLVSFFQSYYNQTGGTAQSILDFITGMPSTTAQDQVRALNQIPAIKSKFHQFARSMVIPNLTDSSGEMAMLAPIPAVERIEVPAATTHFQKTLQILPFTTHNIKLLLKKGKKYRLFVTGDSDAVASIGNALDDSWNSLPYELTTFCDADESDELLITVTKNDLNPVTLNLQIDSEDSTQACPCASSVVDQCLVGNWQLDPTSMRSLVERMLEGANATMTEFDGFETAAIDGHGRLSGSQKWYGAGEGEAGGNHMRIEFEKYGDHVVDLFKSGEGKLCSQGISSNVSGSMTVIVNGMRFSNPIGNSGPYDERADLNYTCNSREFVIHATIPAQRGSNGPIEVVWRYLRQ